MVDPVCVAGNVFEKSVAQLVSLFCLDKEINGSADDGITRHLRSPDAADRSTKRIPPGVAYINAGEEDQMVFTSPCKERKKNEENP